MRKLENKKVDEIGRALVKASALPSSEIDKIVGDTRLFDAVRARIAVENLGKRTGRTSNRWIVPALSACAVLVAVAAVSFVFRSAPTDIVVDRAVPVMETTPANRFAEPDRIVSASHLPTPVAMPRVERVSTPAVTKVSRPRKPENRKSERENEFYALSYAGDPNETERGGRIVRVDLPRTVLFAMGVDIPLENEVETVKADLLVGSDGVTRAIRVVK